MGVWLFLVDPILWFLWFLCLRLPICCGLVPAGLTLTSCCLHWLSSTGSRLSWFVLEHWLSRGLAAVGEFGPYPLLEFVARRPQAACIHPGLDPMEFYFIRCCHHLLAPSSPDGLAPVVFIACCPVAWTIRFSCPKCRRPIRTGLRLCLPR